ncbi:SET domain-containing protein [Solimonas sp. K1W22B-7]|uniref:SET domain-containing protein n=1 Tax=Solimonas sp. K1W22B-7 TaxID=2303331 RepID=UPI000E3362F1|nr:SET domain-containing protein [Solimonas sp. K1W22B-7]AXQ28683.1 SET domain-containing protein [Solimonas sp. K1W22B-7]
MNSLSITPQLEDHPALLVRKDALAYGSALYARRAYRPGEVIARFDDASDAAQSYLTVQVGPERHVLLDMLGNLNHSCRPNVAIDADARTVTACRAILPGDMLSFFYPSTEWDMARPFACQCGEPECVGYIAGARYLSTDTLSRYKVSPHIIGMIGAALAGQRMDS